MVKKWLKMYRKADRLIKQRCHFSGVTLISGFFVPIFQTQDFLEAISSLIYSFPVYFWVLFKFTYFHVSLSFQDVLV